MALQVYDPGGAFGAPNIFPSFPIASPGPGPGPTPVSGPTPTTPVPVSAPVWPTTSVIRTGLAPQSLWRAPRGFESLVSIIDGAHSDIAELRMRAGSCDPLGVPGFPLLGLLSAPLLAAVQIQSWRTRLSLR